MRPAFHEKGAEVTIIGAGPPRQIKGFRAITGFGGVILGDPARHAYRLLGLVSTIRGLVALKPLTRAYAALRAGFRPGSPRGSLLQMGGAVVVSPDEQVLYFFRSREIGEDPPAKDLLAALSR